MCVCESLNTQRILPDLSHPPYVNHVYWYSEEMQKEMINAFKLFFNNQGD